MKERGGGLNEKLKSNNWSSKAKESEIMRFYEGDHAADTRPSDAAVHRLAVQGLPDPPKP